VLSVLFCSGYRLTDAPGNGPGRFVSFQAAASVIASRVANKLLPTTQIVLRAFKAIHGHSLCIHVLITCLRSASPFWKTTANPPSATQNKKVIGAAYSHADILNFSSLYVGHSRVTGLES
jgi:hypothetical protein